MSSNNNKVVPLGKSSAKEKVRELLLADASLLDVDERVLYEMSEDFKQYDEKRFVLNLKNLKKNIKEEKTRVAYEEAALIEDRRKFPKSGNTYWNHIRYDASEAKELLRKDVKDKKTRHHEASSVTADQKRIQTVSLESLSKAHLSRGVRTTGTIVLDEQKGSES
ncbi:hypothetical protein IV203_038280 [Nitzschia inconspicua]|uniref:Uncharacterized protein n=1 Tax=Nitzschia inconspicua TaxID=303405 RepID=A0A9K3LMZ3_9STRA|nr:hypothetical protein IV203_038280 [Nitzschia inconspicua]